MKHIKLFEQFVNENTLYGVEASSESEVIYNSISKNAKVGKKMKVKWEDNAGFPRVACFMVTDVISNDLVVYKKYPGESFSDRDAKNQIFKKDFGIVSLARHWSSGKFDDSKLPGDIVKLVNDLGLKP